MRQNPRLCKYPHKHSDLGFKKENGCKRKRICNSVLDPDFGLKGEAVQYSFCLPFLLKGWLTVFFLGLIVFMGCSLACVHAWFF